MSTSIFLLWLVSIPLIVTALSAPSPEPSSQEKPRGFLLSCGSPEAFHHGDLEYIPDNDYVLVGNTTSVKKAADLRPQLATLRHFPDKSARKYCYVFPAYKGGKYFVRTTYFYGAYDGGKEPPVFDQIVDGTKWSIVNTTQDFAKGEVSYYEIIMAARTKTLSVCLARNQHTDSDPFISAVEVRNLDDSLYNSTDFTSVMLSTVARNSFGKEEEDEEEIVSYPDDPFDRYWHIFKDKNTVVVSKTNITPSDFWNLPPAKVFQTGITSSKGKSLEIKWPPVSLPAGNYYISLYFQDSREPSPDSWRVFDVSVNGENFYTNLNATVNGVNVYSSKWPLTGQTKVVLTPEDDSSVGPIVNAGEVLQLVPLGGRTLTRDVVAMDELARTFENTPVDWRGDPCLPKGNSWTGVVCSTEGKFSRVTALNLTNTGLSGTLSPNVANLTALNNLWLGDNRLSGKIPEMGTLKELRILHLQNNQFEGPIPQSLSQLPKLQDLNLLGNKLDGNAPETIVQTANITATPAPSPTNPEV